MKVTIIRMNINTSYLGHVSESVPKALNLADIINLVTSDEYREIIMEIRGADKDKAKQLKLERLPLFFPTVQVFNKNSLDDNSIPTGIVQFDVDTQDNPGLDFDQLKKVVCEIPETIYAFESPGGGMKFGILTDFKKNDDDDTTSLKKRYSSAYQQSAEYIQEFIEAACDEHMANLKYACFLSHDKNAYYNPDCEMLVINEHCVYEPPQIIATSEQDVSTEQVTQLLDFIPSDFGWNERRPINYAVFSCIGRAGVSVLFNHWITSNRDKLARDLDSQYESRSYGSYGHLVNVAKQYGYKPTTGKARKALLPTPCDFKFQPLVSYTEGMDRLERHLQSFFTTGKNTFINVSTGAGKTEAVIQFLRDLPRRNALKRFNRKRVLVLVPSHNLAAEIKDRLGTHVNHIQGKKMSCERKAQNLDPYYDAGISPPLEQCTQGCHVFSTCPYIRQFDDRLTNIRIMTHAELVNAPSAWLYGSKDGMPRKDGWKPDYIIVDEDWLTKEEYDENYSDTEYDSIRLIIHGCSKGASLTDAINTHGTKVLTDHVAMETGKKKKPVFKSAGQFITDSKKITGKKQSKILKCFHDYIVTGDDEHIKPIRFVKNTLRASLIKPIAERYKDTPTLFLDATADEVVVKHIMDVKFHSVAIKPKDDINLYQLQGRVLLNKDLGDPEFRNQVVAGLKALTLKYNSVGLISYKTISGVDGNFSQWLGRECGIKNVGHFGNIRGLDKFKDVDCLLIVGRYLIPGYELDNYCYGVFGESIKDKEYADVPVRMQDGSSMTLNNRLFVDPYMRRIKKQFSDSETIQAIGRARLIHGSPKDIYLFSHESLGADVEVSSFFELADLIDSPEALALKEIGFCQDNPKNLHDLGYPKSRIKNNRDQIDKELIKAGINKVKIKVRDSNRNTREKTYYVHDMEKLERKLAEDGCTIV